MGCTSREKSVRNKRRVKPIIPYPKTDDNNNNNINHSCDEKKNGITQDSNCRAIKFFGKEKMKEKISEGYEDSEEADWGYCTEDQLEDLLLRNLEHAYNEAVCRIASLGYSPEESLKAVLWNGHCYGNSDVFTNIVNNSLAYLKNGNSYCFGESDVMFRDLKQVEEYALTSMVCLLRQVRPELSKGDAMWCLLMSDLHVGRASSLEVPSLPHADDNPSPKSNAALPSASPASPTVSSPSSVKPSGGSAPAFVAVKSVSSEPCKMCAESKKMSMLPMDASFCQNGFTFDAGALHSGKVVSTSNAGLSSSMKLALLKKSAAAIFANRVHCERKLKANANSQLCPHVVDGKSELPASQNESGCSSAKKHGSKQEKGSRTEKDTANAGTDLSLGMASAPDAEQSSSKTRNCQDIVGAILGSLENLSISDKSDGVDHRNEIMLKLMHQVRDSELQLKDRIEWAQQKAMQAAKKLSKDLAELKVLRMERDEILHLRKDKQTLEETTMKRLSEMENALRKASGQVDRANAAVKRLENDNAELRAELEACKLSAAESVSTCQEIAKKEKKFLKRTQAWEKQKSKIQEEINEDKQKATELQLDVSRILDMQKETETKWKQEEKTKDSALAQAEEERRAKDAVEAAARRKEDAMQRKTEMDFQRYRDDIERLEQERARLKAAAESSQQNVSSNNPYTSDGASIHRMQELNAHLRRELQERQVSSKREGSNDRQCRICSSEEVSVLFLPCAHQVVCVKCNDMQEKKCSVNCPSCKTTIKQRIRVYGASS